jgi:outer membrane immunogenic protein
MELIKRNKLLIGAALLALVVGYFLWSGKAFAAGWTGCYVGGGGGYATTLTDTEIDYKGKAAIGVDSFGAQGPAAFGIVGCDVQMQRFVVGVFADYTHFSDVDFTVSAPAFTNANILETSLNNAWSAGGRVGYLVTPEALIYGLVAYTEADTDDISSPALKAKLSVPTLQGYVLGGGAEIALGKGFFARAEYTYSQYDEETLAISKNLSVDLDTSAQVARFGLAWKFGGEEVERIVPGSAPLK